MYFHHWFHHWSPISIGKSEAFRIGTRLYSFHQNNADCSWGVESYTWYDFLVLKTKIPQAICSPRCNQITFFWRQLLHLFFVSSIHHNYDICLYIHAMGTHCSSFMTYVTDICITGCLETVSLYLESVNRSRKSSGVVLQKKNQPNVCMAKWSSLQLIHTNGQCHLQLKV